MSNNPFSDYERWKFIVLPYEYRNHILPRELMLDFDRNILYLRNIENTKNLQLSYPELEVHLQNMNNPHMVNKTQVGLGNVKNIKQASLEDFTNHIDKNNPHNVTKELLILDKLENYAPAKIQDVDNKSPDKYMTAEQLNYYIEVYKQTIGKYKKLVFGIYPSTALIDFTKNGTIYNDKEYEVEENMSYPYKIYNTGYFDTVGVANISQSKAINIRMNELFKLPEDNVKESLISLSNNICNIIGLDNSITSCGSDIYFEVSNSAPGTNYEQVFSGTNFSIAITENKGLYGWGNNSKGCISQIPINVKFSMLSIHESTVMGLTVDGTIMYWGEVPQGMTDNMVPSDRFKYIACGKNHSIGIRTNGTIACWGSLNKNQATGLPVGDNYIQVVSGTDYTLALNSEGSIKAFGDNTLGQINNIPDTKGNTYIFANDDISGCIDSSGSIQFFRDSISLSIDRPREKSFIQVKVKNGVGLGLRHDGTVIAWGNDDKKIISRTPKDTIFKALPTLP